MTNKQQIHEMAKDCYYVAHLLKFNDPYMLSLTGWSKLTEEMVKLGWIKPSKDSIVLTREEYDNMFSFKTTRGGFYNILDTVKEVQSQETAKEVLKWLVDTGVINTAPDTIKMYFKERFGVEVK